MEVIDYLNKKFEGEEEINFTIVSDENIKKSILKIWHGHFVFLMDEIFIANRDMNLCDIAKSYSLYEGWYDEELWESHDIELFYNQFSKINIIDKDSDLIIIKKEILRFVKKCIETKSRLFISYL